MDLAVTTYSLTKAWPKEELYGDCREFCARGHDDGKERIIAWLLRRNFWTNCLPAAIRMRCLPRTDCSTT
ncbi:hypothetical protein NKJ48_15440 [Mesorhizobium sp. M0114]